MYMFGKYLDAILVHNVINLFSQKFVCPCSLHPFRYSCFLFTFSQLWAPSVVVGSDFSKPESIFVIMAGRFPISYFLSVDLRESTCTSASTLSLCSSNFFHVIYPFRIFYGISVPMFFLRCFIFCVFGC